MDWCSVQGRVGMVRRRHDERDKEEKERYPGDRMNDEQFESYWRWHDG